MITYNPLIEDLVGGKTRIDCINYLHLISPLIIVDIIIKHFIFKNKGEPLLRNKKDMPKTMLIPPT